MELVAQVSNDYFLRDHNVDGSEWDRLDNLHNGIRTYLGGSLSFASIVNPSRIMDVGAGSGAWAIQAAKEYPGAGVTAADIAPLPSRPLPGNVSYVPLDVLRPYNFKPESFDVIHIRLLLYHLPRASMSDFLERTIALLRPGGWLLVEDVGRHWGHECSRGPAQLAFDKIFMGMLRTKGLDPLVGEHLEKLLQDTGAFESVNIKKVQLVLSTDQDSAGPSPEVRAFSNALRTSIERIVAENIGNDLRAAGVTKEIQWAWLDERSDPAFKTFHDFWFTWSRKHEI